MKKSYLTVTDQFCGAGGSSLGAVAAGAELRLALNHWQLAIETHSSNFPQAAHDCTDISACDPRRYQATDILITSPECTNHSLAKGKRKPMQADLFGNAPDPAEERSRATMWDVPRFAEVHRYNAIVVENVVDARQWVNWTAWLLAMRQLGYDYKAVFLNSMFAHPTPQSRDRMYVVFWRKGNRAPDLEIRPAAWCHRCGKDVAAVQTWKAGKRFGRYRQQYVYCCPECAAQVEPYYYCAASAIDWTLPAPRIGDRDKPLKAKTMERIRVGLEKFGRQAMAIDTSFGDGDRAALLTEPMRTQTTRQTIGMAVPPFLLSVNHSSDRVRPATDPAPTVMTQGNPALVAPPFLVDIVHNGRYGRHQDLVWSVTGPDRTQIAQNTKALVVPYYSEGRASGTDEPLPTVTTVDRHALAVPPFLLGYYTRPSGQQAAISGVDEPMPTQSTQPRHYLVQPGDVPAVEDCGFRMLQPHEIQAAMAFPQDYKVLGTKRERTRQLGNAVPPPAMAILMQRVVETFS
jgi:DNA (cytosine-5)-methyltransferase 1